MSPSAKKFYADWRAQSVESNLLRDANDFPAERLLQAIWQHQRLRRDGLKTSGGKSVRVLHPGFVSAAGGPDFRDAVLQFENEKPVSGDVEIDLRAGNWRAHDHDKNPNFKNVLLHVIWENEVQSLKSNVQNSPTILPLKNFLDAPLAELSSSLENESLRSLPETLRGKCCAPLRELSETKLLELLHQAARVRFENKAKQFLTRAKIVGWEQTLWENLFRALGYKNNVWPMQNLAEMKPLWSRGLNSAFELQTRLLGVGGLLPSELTRAQKSSDTYLRRIWDLWWRERDEFSEIILPRSIWKFHGLRPANHPQRRLALAAHWLADKNFVSNIEGWIATEINFKPLTPTLSPLGRGEGEKLLRSLHQIFAVEHDEFWSWHWTFKSARLAKPQLLLGEARATDLVANVILPWLWIRAVEGRNEKIQREVERRFFAWPTAEDNSILKLARQRLLGTSGARIFTTAATQQGLLQIVRDFCANSNALCENCRFPELARDWNQSAVT
ncbi:MAG TPA: DUF2851 family protein [Verrucomicrobiae bacterium]|nr:DUF2851 family protein [Verrucomicrobiae bacterium]